MNEIDRLLGQMESVGASDLHLKAGSPPIYRVNGVPRRVEGQPLAAARIVEMIREVLTPEQFAAVEEQGSLDLARSVPEVGRFRVNVFRQRGAFSFCARRVNTEIPSIEELHLPKVINRLAGFEDGLVAVVGPTGSGKSSTLASIIQRINLNRRCHVLTIEDPIEFIYRDDKAFINQREIGLDCPGFHTALKYALRQDPDVILVGEMRDADTIETALAAAETGHLVLTTLHANNAMQTLSRVLDFFPGDRHEPIRKMLAVTLRAVVAQRLLPGATDEAPRVPAAEVMLVNAVVRKIIAENEDHRLPGLLRKSTKEGMQDFNISLYRLAQAGLVTEEAALEHSPNREQLAMQFKGMVLNEDQAAMD
jgi:twitching motility protein PilT